VQGDAVSGLGGPQLCRSRLEPFSKLAETRSEGLRDENFVEATVVPRHQLRDTGAYREGF